MREIRLPFGIIRDPKVLKLMRHCGDRAFYCLIRLWTWVAEYRPDGALSGFDKEDIEIIAGWTGVGVDGVFTNGLLKCGLLEERDGELFSPVCSPVVTLQ